MAGDKDFVNMMDLSGISIMAGVAKIDITHTQSERLDDPLYANIDASNVNDRLYVKALVLKQRDNMLVFITVDAVAIAEIGTIRDSYLEQVRNELQDSLNIKDHFLLKRNLNHIEN